MNDLHMFSHYHLNMGLLAPIRYSTGVKPRDREPRTPPSRVFTHYPPRTRPACAGEPTAMPDPSPGAARSSISFMDQLFERIALAFSYFFLNSAPSSPGSVRLGSRLSAMSAGLLEVQLR